MSKTREKKEDIVSELTEKLSTCSSGVIADYRGLNVAKITELRRKLREAGVEFRVVKNTLTRFAAQKAGIEDMDQLLEGPTAIAFSFADPLAPSKELFRFAKENKELKIKGGLLEGKVIPLEKVKMLADLPSKEEILSQIARGMQAPLMNLGYVLSSNIRNIVYVLEAVRKKREEEK